MGFSKVESRYIRIHPCSLCSYWSTEEFDTLWNLLDEEGRTELRASPERYLWAQAESISRGFSGT